MNAEENCKVHHTVDYVIASPRVKKDTVTPGTLIVRRGTEFTVKLLFNRNYNKENDQLHFVFELGDFFLVEALPQCRTYIFLVVINFLTFRLTFLRMRDKCKIINVQRNDKAFFVLMPWAVC